MSQQIKFYNVTINYSDLGDEDLNDEEGIGQCRLQLEDQKICKLLKHCKEELFLYYNLGDSIYDWNPGDALEVYNADDIIALLYALTQLKPFSSIPNIELTVSYDHLIWLLHDFCHVCNDTSLSEDRINVEVHFYSEREAIEYSINMLNDLEIPLPYHILEQTKIEFEERFKEPLNIGWTVPTNQYQNLDKFNINDWF